MREPWGTGLALEPSGGLTELTSSLSPCSDFSRTKAPMPPLTRISSPMWYLRMLASSLALPAGKWGKEAGLTARLATGMLRAGRPRRNTPRTDLEHSSSTYNLFNPLTLCLYYTLAHGDDYRLGPGVGGLLSEVGDSETQRRN